MSRADQGIVAEEIAAAFERLRLGMASKNLKYVGNRRGIGFDLQSHNSEADLTPRFIEVKSIAKNGNIFFTERERINLKALGSFAWLYLVDVRLKKVVKMIQNPMRLFDEDKKAITYRIKI